MILAACAAFVSLAATDVHAQTAGQKFGRGLAGMTCGFLEVPGNIVKETKERGAIGVPVGLALGVGMLVARELVGVYEFVTAPFPVPVGYQPILRPEYPWDYFAAAELENYTEDAARVLRCSRQRTVTAHQGATDADGGKC